MKSYFYTTLIKNEKNPQNAFIGSETTEFKGLSSICIPRTTPAFIVSNHYNLSIFSIDNYKIITLYLKEISIKCI